MFIFRYAFWAIHLRLDWKASSGLDFFALFKTQTEKSNMQPPKISHLP